MDDKDTQIEGDDSPVTFYDSGFAGNLMAPPFVEFCIDVTPDEAEVTVSGVVVDDGDCTLAEDGYPVQVEATLEGYEDYAEDVQVEGDPTNHVFEMTPESDQ